MKLFFKVLFASRNLVTVVYKKGCPKIWTPLPKFQKNEKALIYKAFVRSLFVNLKAERCNSEYGAFKTLGIYGKYSNHDWRSTFGSQLKEQGMSSALVADLLGHADTRMVETTYARTRHEGVMKQRQAVENLNAFL